MQIGAAREVLPPGTHNRVEYVFRITTPDGRIQDTQVTDNPHASALRCGPGVTVTRRERRITTIVEEWRDSVEDGEDGA